MKSSIVALLFPIALAAELPGQTDPEPAAAPAADASAPPQKLAWPRDRARPVCRVGGEHHTLEDLISRIDARHYPGMLKFIATPGGQLYFQSDKPARWVRQFADIVALEKVAAERGVGPAKQLAAVAAALKSGFEAHLADYTRWREKQGRPVELTQKRVNMLLTDYQREYGLELEVRALLDLLAPATDVEETDVLRGFFEDHPQFFGGVVTIAQILIHHRDPITGELLVGDDREAAYAKLADVQARLKPDGSNFEDVARLLSDDRKTAARGGLLKGIERVDPDLPAILCRTAWSLEDRELSKPFESPFGIHVVKRRSWSHKTYFLFTDAVKPIIARVKRAVEQEDLLFETRERFGVKLEY